MNQKDNINPGKLYLIGLKRGKSQGHWPKLLKMKRQGLPLFTLKGPYSATPGFVNMPEFGYYILFGACQNKKIIVKLLKIIKHPYFQEHNLQGSNKVSLHRAIKIISMASKMVTAD